MFDAMLFPTVFTVYSIITFMFLIEYKYRAVISAMPNKDSDDFNHSDYSKVLAVVKLGHGFTLSALVAIGIGKCSAYIAVGYFFCMGVIFIYLSSFMKRL